MKHLKKYIGIALLALMGNLILTSCGEEETPSTPQAGKGRITLAVATTSGAKKTMNARIASPGQLSFTKGKIKFREVVFDGEMGGKSISETVEKIAVIDYSDGKINPEVFIEIPTGIYTDVNLGVEIQDDGSDPSIVIEGTYMHSEDGRSLPIRFEFNSGEVFEANAQRVEIKEGTNLVGQITFDALDWFSVISAEELDNAVLANGVIIISETKNSDIFDEVADRLDVATQAVFK